MEFDAVKQFLLQQFCTSGNIELFTIIHVNVLNSYQD